MSGFRFKQRQHNNLKHTFQFALASLKSIELQQHPLLLVEIIQHTYH